MNDIYWNRRAFLQTGVMGLGHAALVNGLCADGSLPETGQIHSPKYVQRAKRVLFLFMKGGPSQVDTFDYKPELKRCHGRPLPFEKPKVQFAKTGNLLASPWEFKRYGECGHAVSELFPEVAKQVDDLCFIPCMEPIRLMGPRFSSCTRAAITSSSQVWVHGSHMGWGRKTKIFLPSYPFARLSLMAGPRTGVPPFFPILIRDARLAMHRLIRRRQGWGTFPTIVIPSSSKRLRFE